MVQAPEVSVRTIHGASDYLGTSISLRVTLRKANLQHQREYLFGVGSGIARAGLEHKCRPSRNLRATFSCTLDSSSCGGLGGLVLRLKADGHGKVTFVGPNGIAAQVQALQNLVRWTHPKVTVSEFPDMDDGKPVYEDDAVAVFTVTKPSTPWSQPHFAATQQDPGGTVMRDHDNATDKGTHASSSRSSSSCRSSSEEPEDSEQSEVDDDDRKRQANSLQPPADSEEEPSTDSDDESKAINLENLQQQQLFRKMDDVFLNGGTATDIVGSIRNHVAGRRHEHQTAGLQQPRLACLPSRGKRTFWDEQAELQQTPKRVRSCVNALQASHEPAAISNSDKSRVIVTRCATGSISKQAAGACGFLVQVKGSSRLLLFSFTADIGQLQCLARHPVIPFLNGRLQQPDDNRSAAPDASRTQLACLHLCEPTLHNLSAFHKLLDHLPNAEHFALEHGVLANKGFVHCASVRLQAKLNLLDPAIFRLPAQLSSPPLKAVYSSVCEHQAAGTQPAPQEVALASVNCPVPAHTRTAGPSKLANRSRGEEDTKCAEDVSITQQQKTPACSTWKTNGRIEVAEAACADAEAAEAAANTAKCELDKARAALAAVRTALAASSSTDLKNKLTSAREAADEVVKERAAAHIKALACMREAAEAAEAACCAAEHVAAPCRPSAAPAGLPAAENMEPPTPHTPVAPPPPVQQNACLPLQRVAATMLGTLCEVHWPSAPAVGPSIDPEAPSADTCAIRTSHGSIVKGSCLQVAAHEQHGGWAACQQHAVAEQCPVDVMCVQAATLLQHSQFADALPELRRLFAHLRGLCASPTGPGQRALQHCQPHPCAPVAHGAPAQCSLVAVPVSHVLEDKPADASVCQAPHTEQLLPGSGVPQSTQQALSVLGPQPPAAACWAGTTATFLGTGCSEPSKYRGPSGLLLEVGGANAGAGATVLLDCGESVWETMCSMMGKARAQMCVNSLAAVWVSHKHADHCLGLPGLLAARTPQRPALVLALPAAVWDWIREGYPYLLDRVKYVHCSHFSSRALSGGSAASRGAGGGRDVMTAAGFTAWQCVPVRHCFDAYGIVLEHAQGWKVVVSGDTAPCTELVAAGMHATLLVHEATFSCDLARDAAAKRHSTIGQALEAAQRMGAWRVVLTHFSQRYSRFAPHLQQLPFAAAARAFAVFDGARVSFTDLWLLPVVHRAMEMLATEEAEEAAELAAEESADGLAQGQAP